MSVLDPVALLRRAVETPSVSGEERQVAEFMVSQMQRFACQALIDEAGNAVCRVGRGPTRVVFLGHIDTAPGWLPVRIEHNALWGRGAVDAKGSFCAAVVAASRLGSEVLDQMELTLIGAVEEEAATSKGARHAVRTQPTPQAAIIGEPSGWEGLTLGYKGRLVLNLTAATANFHSAGQGVTAAEAAATVWQRLQAYVTSYNRELTNDSEFERLQASLQSFNTQSDGLLQQAAVTVGFRLPPAIGPEALEASLRSIIEPPDDPTRLRARFSGHERAYRAPKDNPLSRAFRQAIRSRGGRPRFKVKTGTSDMNVVAPHWPVPMVAYGPGDSTLDHSPHERLAIDEYLRACDVLQSAFETMARRRDW